MVRLHFCSTCLLLALVTQRVSALVAEQPIRIAFVYPDLPEQAKAIYECREGEFVQLGQPSAETFGLQLCDSQDIRNPFKPLSLETDCWHRCTAGDRITPEAQHWFQERVEAVRTSLQQSVTLLWPVDEVPIASGRDARVSTSEGDAEAPTICPAIPLPMDQELPTGSLEPGNGEGDLRVYVTFRPNPAAATGATTVCRRDGFGRPAIAHINMHAAFVAATYAAWERGNSTRGAAAATYGLAAQGRAEIRAENAILHEMMHALAMTSASLQQFRTLSRRLRGSVVRATEVRGIEAQFLVTPNARYAVRQHYQIVMPASGPEEVPGLEIIGYSEAVDGPQQELPPNSEVHLSPQVSRSDIASAAPDQHAGLTLFSQAILNDTGWYHAVGQPAEHLWGQGLNSSFLEKQPVSNLTAASAYNCLDEGFESKTVACSYHPDFKGFCKPATAVSNVVPARALSSFVEPLPALGSCKDGGELTTSPFFETEALIADQYGNSSRCVAVRRASREKAEAVCLVVTCTPSGVSVTVGNATLTCPFSGQVTVAVQLTGSGQVVDHTLMCPSRLEACPQYLDAMPCPRDCSAPHGTCNGETGTCTCEDGWAGPDCSEYSCTGGGVCDNGSLATQQEAAAEEMVNGVCQAGTCHCSDGFTGVDCRLPEPVCSNDCSLLGAGYHCVGDTCEKQCSTGGGTCVEVQRVQEGGFRDCDEAFRTADTQYVCIPEGDVSTQVSGLRSRHQRELQRWRPRKDSPDAQSAACTRVVEHLACFNIFRECKPEEDIELPLCLAFCDSYSRSCGVQPERPCREPLFRSTSSSRLCSGTANANELLTRGEKFGIIFGSVLAFVLLVLVAALCAFRCRPCCPPRTDLQTVTMTHSPMEETPTQAVMHSGDMEPLRPGVRANGVHGDHLTHPHGHTRQPCTSWRLRWRRRPHSMSNPYRASQAFAPHAGSVVYPSISASPQGVSEEPSSLEGSGALQPIGGVSDHSNQMPHAGSAVSTAKRPDLPSSALPSRPPSQSCPGEVSTGDSGLGTPASQPSDFALSHSAHNTMQRMMPQSAFAEKAERDAQPELQNGWHPEDMSCAVRAQFVGRCPAERKMSGSSSVDGPLAATARTHSNVSRSPTPLTSSPYPSQPLSQPSGPQIDIPTGVSADGARTVSSISSRQLQALSGSVVINATNKGRMPGAHVVRKRRGRRRAADSSGTAPSLPPSAPGEADARSDVPSSPSRSRSATSPTGDCSPLRNLSTSLDVAASGAGLAVQPPSPRTSGTPGAATPSHASSLPDPSLAASGRASSRRSGDASPLRSAQESGGAPPRAPSPQIPAAPSAPHLAASSGSRTGTHTPVDSRAALPPVPPGAVPIQVHYPPAHGDQRGLQHLLGPEGVFPPPPQAAPQVFPQEEERREDPFLDDDSPKGDQALEEDVSLVLDGGSMRQAGGGLSSLSRDQGPGSITLQLPSTSFHTSRSFHSAQLSPRQRAAASVSFGRAVRPDGGMAAPVVAAASGLSLERRAGQDPDDPFLAETGVADEGIDMTQSLAWDEPSSSIAEQVPVVVPAQDGLAVNSLGRAGTVLNRVSEVSEVLEEHSAVLGTPLVDPASGQVRARRISNASVGTQGSAASDPFLGDS